MKPILPLILSLVLLFGYNSGEDHTDVRHISQDDALLWEVATAFTAKYNSRDISGMGQLLPDGFMLQWLHQNFLEKKSLLAFMGDSACHASLTHLLIKDSKVNTRYSDDLISASLNVPFRFINPSMAEAIEREKGYGLCIMYFQNRRGKWRLQTVHLDLHCYNCNL